MNGREFPSQAKLYPGVSLLCTFSIVFYYVPTYIESGRNKSYHYHYYYKKWKNTYIREMTVVEESMDQKYEDQNLIRQEEIKEPTKNPYNEAIQHSK